MTFQVIRNSDPACEPTCPAWIYAAGSIETSSPSALRKLLKSLGAVHLPIVLASNGGDRQSAQELGRIARKNKLTIAIGTSPVVCKDKASVCRTMPEIDGQGRFEEANCLSACPLFLAGGVKRLNSDRNFIAVHKGQAVLYSNGDRTFTQIKSAKRVAKVLANAHLEKKQYLREMGVAVALEDEAFKHGGDDFYEVPIDRQRSWGLITGSVEELDFTDPQFCKRQPLPENCVPKQNGLPRRKS
ncbi:hypothetical protein [Mesorhizobium sp. M0323]|uniref:hypothetical protein n=1 Tax=unclassified Mesorhizobium TaxID=325217 RepID=UPI003337C4B5